MSTLFVNTIYPDSGSIVNISGSLKISQSLIVADNITMSGSIKLGDATTDSVSLTAEISSSIIPDATVTYNLGSTVKEWNKLHIANITASGEISASGIVYGKVGKFDELELPPFTTITASGGISASIFRGDGSELTGVGTTGSVLDVVSVSVDTFVSGAGTGSFNHFFVSGEISGSVSASGTGSFQGGVVATGATGSFGYIATSNVSSSGTGSFQGGIESPNATGSFGYISSSGDISSSGTGSFEFLQVTSEIVGNVSASGTGSFKGGIDCIGDGSGMTVASGAFGYISTSADIFVGGELSGSGEITTNTFSTTHNGITKLTINTDGVLSSSSDIEINTGSFFRGDGRLLTNITSSAAVGGANTQVLFNDNGAVGGESGITYATSSLTLANIGDSIATLITVEISASRISASNGFEADGGSTSLFGFISCSGNISSSGTGSFLGGVDANVHGFPGTGSFGYISCSGEISMSGTLAVDGNITASGIISGSLIKGQSFQAQVGNNLGYRFNLNDDSQINGIQYNTIGERAHLQIPSLPVSVTLPFSASATALVGGNLTVGGTSTTAGTTTTNGTLNGASGFQIGGVAMTATAAELNKMDGFGGTTAQLNSLIKTSAAAIEGGKSVDYDEDGAVKFKIPKKTTSVTLTVGDSGTTLMPIAASAQSFTLPNPSDSNGVFFNFIAGSAQAHRIISPTNKIQGFILDMSNNITTGDASVGVTRVTNQAVITLVNPEIGDNLQLVSDGDNWYVRGYLKDTPALTQV